MAEKHLGAKPNAIQELKEGWFNAAYMLSQPDGREFVLKIAPPPEVKLLRYEENILEVEVETMRLMEAKTDLPIPHIVAYDRERAEVGSEYFFMERLPGVPFNLVRADLEEAAQIAVQTAVGQCLRTMHGINHPTFGLYNRPIHATWREAFGEMLGLLRQDGLDLEVDIPAGAFEAGEKLMPVLDSVQTACFVHWDLWDGNVFVEEGKLTGIIDFERALWGDPLIETTFLERRLGLMEGYGSDIFSTPYAKERRLLYDLYLFLVMVIETKFRGFTPEHEAWPRMKLTETLEQISLLG